MMAKTSVERFQAKGGMQNQIDAANIEQAQKQTPQKPAHTSCRISVSQESNSY